MFCCFCKRNLLDHNGEEEEGGLSCCAKVWQARLNFAEHWTSQGTQSEERRGETVA